MTKILFRGDTDIGFVYSDELGERPSSLSHELGIYAASKGYEFSRIGPIDEKALSAAKPEHQTDYAICRVVERDNHKVLDVATRRHYLPSIEKVWNPED